MRICHPASWRGSGLFFFVKPRAHALGYGKCRPDGLRIPLACGSPNSNLSGCLPMNFPWQSGPEKFEDDLAHHGVMHLACMGGGLAAVFVHHLGIGTGGEELLHQLIEP